MRALLVWLLLLISLGSSRAADDRRLELVFFERSGCPWCIRFEREVAPIYPKTSAGQVAPLRKVNLDDRLPPELSLRTPVRFTPTFVLVDRGKEVGRITGYMNDATFWGLIEKLLASPPGD